MGFRADATELGNARRRVEALISSLPGEAGERAFEHPWELRAFAIAVAAYHNGQYEWSEFQLALIDAIKKWEQGEAEPWSYYQHWLTALETVLAGNGLLSEAALDEGTKALLATPRDAEHQRARPEPVAVDPAR
jgi:nitrile hydratase accessory protein